MRRLFLIPSAVAVFALNAFGQSANPTPTPTPDDTDVVKISTSLIQVDVAVTDSKGKPITDLKQSEIEIYENGKKQNITNFSFVSSVRETVAKQTPADKNAVPLPPSELRVDKIRRTFALVVDDLSLSFESAYQTRRALKKFVDEQMQSGDLVAIIRTGAGIGALQQFTADKRVLYAAIERVRWNPQGSGGIGAFAPIESAADTSLQPSDTSSDPAASASGTGAGQSLDDFRSSVFATGTLGALRYIVTGMGELPGRKSVILFSDGFKMFEKDENGFETSGRVMDFLRQLIDTANRSSVVFYTIDPRGLQTLGFTAQDSVTDTSPDAMNSARTARRDQLLDTQAGLDFLATETGGFAVKNSNDLTGGVSRVLNDQSYYLVAYEPDDTTFDAAKRKFNKFEVKVLRKGVNVRYRSGFFNVSTPAKATPAPSTQTLGQKLQTALVSPFAVGGISMRLNALFANDPKTGSYVRSLLHVDAKDLKFVDKPDGSKQAVMDVLAASFGDNGQIIDQIGKSYTLTIKPERMKRLLENGFVYSFTFPVKKPGAYQYRVAIHDSQSEAIGSASQFIDVPNIKKGGPAISSIVLESLSPDQWKTLNEANGGTASGVDPVGDTAMRRVKLGSVLRYGYEIYNVKLSPAKQPDITVKARIFCDGKLVMDGKSAPIELRGQTDMERLKNSGGLTIGQKLPKGDYILQIIVTDNLARPKQQIATQFVQFEVVD